MKANKNTHLAFMIVNNSRLERTITLTETLQLLSWRHATLHLLQRSDSFTIWSIEPLFGEWVHPTRLEDRYGLFWRETALSH